MKVSKRIYHPKRTNGEWYKLDAADFGAVMNLKKYVAGKWYMGVTL